MAHRALLAAALATCALMPPALPAAASASGPGVDEYTLNIPGAGGNHPPGGSHPSGGAGPASLPPAVRAELAGPDAGLLRAVATSPALGAPPASAGMSHASPGTDPDRAEGSSSPFPAPSASFSGAAVRTAGDSPALLLIGAIVALAALAGAWALRLRARGRGA